jgi:hypothetical protein
MISFCTTAGIYAVNMDLVSGCLHIVKPKVYQETPDFS